MIHYFIAAVMVLLGKHCPRSPSFTSPSVVEFQGPSLNQWVGYMSVWVPGTGGEWSGATPSVSAILPVHSESAQAPLFPRPSLRQCDGTNGGGESHSSARSSLQTVTGRRELISL